MSDFNLKSILKNFEGNRKLWIIFQMDVNSDFYMDIPLSDRMENRQDSRLRAACSSFMLHVVTRAAREMLVETAQTGFRFVQYDIERTYSVMQTDFASFARRVSFFLQNKSICYVRLKVCTLLRFQSWNATIKETCRNIFK